MPGRVNYLIAPEVKVLSKEDAIERCSDRSRDSSSHCREEARAKKGYCIGSKKTCIQPKQDT
jgi:hypothetical protein